MKDSVLLNHIVAGDPTITHGASRRHLRLIQPLTPTMCSDERAHQLLTQNINDDADPDDPPITVLAW